MSILSAFLYLCPSTSILLLQALEKISNRITVVAKETGLLNRIDLSSHLSLPDHSYQ